MNKPVLEVGMAYRCPANGVVATIVDTTKTTGDAYIKFTVEGDRPTTHRGLFHSQFLLKYSERVSAPKFEGIIKVKMKQPVNELPSSAELYGASPDNPLVAEARQVSDTEFFNKYTRSMIGFCGKVIKVNVYRVLDAFAVTNPQLQHLIKKALCVGQRGHKSTIQDYKDILDSAQSAYDMAIQKENLKDGNTI